MKKTKLASFTLKLETVKKLDEYANKNSINKSALVDKLINREIDKMNIGILDRLKENPPINYALILAPADKQLINEKDNKKESDEE